jgi:hypothetical protein
MIIPRILQEGLASTAESPATSQRRARNPESKREWWTGQRSWIQELWLERWFSRHHEIHWSIQQVKPSKQPRRLRPRTKRRWRWREEGPCSRHRWMVQAPPAAGQPHVIPCQGKGYQHERDAPEAQAACLLCPSLRNEASQHHKLASALLKRVLAG